MHIAIFAGKAKVLLFKPRLFLIKITVIFGDLYLCQKSLSKQRKIKNFIFGIFVVVQIFLKPV